MTTPIMPLGSIADFKRLRGQAPLLDLEHIFNVNLEEFRKHVESFNPSVPSGMSFAAHRRLQIKRLPRAIQEQIRDRIAGDEVAAQAHELEQSFTYLLNIRPADVSAKKLKAHFSLLSRHLETTLEVGSSVQIGELAKEIVSLFLGPLLKWIYDNPSFASKELELGFAERLLDIAHECSPEDVTGRHLELRNALVFVYIWCAYLFEKDISPIHFARHLRLIRATSSVTWNEFPPALRVRYGALALYTALLFFPLDEPFAARHGFSLNTLSDLRAALADAAVASGDSGPALLVHQAVFRGIQEKLELEVFSTRTLRGSKAPTIGSLSQGELLAASELVRKFSGFRIPITADSLTRFLRQFGTTQRIRGALRLLTHTRFFPYWELADSIQQTLREERDANPHLKKLVLAPLGDRTGSTSIINYLASHSSLADKLEFADNIPHALSLTKGSDPVYFIDDCALSGTQTLAILGDLLGTRVRKPHYTRYADALPAPQRVEFEKRTITFVYCIACDFALERLTREVPATGLDPNRVVFRQSVVEPLSARAFGPMSPVAWATSAERDELREFAIEVGYDLLEQRSLKKRWSDERRRESALGFSDFQRLLVFPYNVPKSTLTLLWHSGNATRAWDPLFLGHD